METRQTAAASHAGGVAAGGAGAGNSTRATLGIPKAAEDLPGLLCSGEVACQVCHKKKRGIPVWDSSGEGGRLGACIDVVDGVRSYSGSFLRLSSLQRTGPGSSSSLLEPLQIDPSMQSWQMPLCKYVPSTQPQKLSETAPCTGIHVVLPWLRTALLVVHASIWVVFAPHW